MSCDKAQRHDELMNHMAREKAKWVEEGDSDEDTTDGILNQAIEAAIAQGKGWKDGEKEAYMARICDDDKIPALFATSQEDLEKSGIADAFSSLVYEGESPTSLMLSFKKKGNDSFVCGTKNKAKNVQYYRDAINRYYEAIAWAKKIIAFDSPDDFPPESERKSDDPLYTKGQLNEVISSLYANAAMAHLQLRNWGYARDNSLTALEYNDKNIKSWYRLAKAYKELGDWEACGGAIHHGLEAANGGAGSDELKRLERTLDSRIRTAKLQKQKRERARAERVSNVKKVWKWCNENCIQLGRVPLVASVTDEEENDANSEVQENRWHHHHPHTGKLPTQINENEFSWPVLFVYPASGESDFIEYFSESEMIALRMAEIFPELEDEKCETSMPWDYNNEYTCSNLVVYFEVHDVGGPDNVDLVAHPELVEKLESQGEAIRFFEASRALKGDEGPNMASLVRAVERKKLHQQRKVWKKNHGSLWSRPGPSPLIQVHPATTLKDALKHKSMVVPNFLPTFLLFPFDHPAHQKCLKERQIIGVVQPN